MKPDDDAPLQIAADSDLAAAMAAIRKNARGMILIHNADRRVIGLLTDGDISKALLKHENMHAPAIDHMNREFVWVSEGAPKEQTLKLLDSRIRAIPVLDAERRLVSLVSTGYLEPRPEIFARAKAPARISLAGGGTDFTQYFMQHGGVSLSATIAKHSHAVLRRRTDKVITCHSEDHAQSITFESLTDIAYDGNLDLFKAAIKVIKPDYGFDLWVNSDYPPGSGLGGSATVLSAVIGCLNVFREDKLDNYHIAEHAFEAERIELSISGGWQDQYSTVFGGFNFIELNGGRNTVTPLRIDAPTMNELEERFILCYTGSTHLGETIQAGNRGRNPNDPDVVSFANDIKAIALEMKAHLIRGNLSDFGRMLDETWQLKKKFNPIVTNETIDRIYDAAMNAGAEGGRLLGTGGGGYFLFFVKPFERCRVSAALRALGLATESVVFDNRGLQYWAAR